MDSMSENWIRIAKVDDVPEQGTLQVTVAGEPVCLYNLAGTIHATHDVCTHGHASLSEGFIVDDNLIECPLHQGKFDILTGEAVSIPCIEDVKVYPVRVEEGNIFLKM